MSAVLIKAGTSEVIFTTPTARDGICLLEAIERHAHDPNGDLLIDVIEPETGVVFAELEDGSLHVHDSTVTQIDPAPPKYGGRPMAVLPTPSPELIVHVAMTEKQAEFLLEVLDEERDRTELEDSEVLATDEVDDRLQEITDVEDAIETAIANAGGPGLVR